MVLECQQRASRLSVVPGGRLRKAKCEQVATEKRGLKQFHKDSLLAKVSHLRRLLEPWQKLFPTSRRQLQASSFSGSVGRFKKALNATKKQHCLG